MMNWWRAHHGISNDAKLAVVAARAGVKKCEVGWVWVILLDHASQANDRGSIADLLADPDEIMVMSDIPSDVIKKIIDSLRSRGLITENGRLSAWNKRQPVREREEDPTTAERTRRHRERIKAGATSSLSYVRHQNEVFARDGHVCVYCGDATASNLTIDHGIPVCQGGDDDLMNLYCACKGCNSGKSGRTPEEAGYSFVNKAAEALFAENLVRFAGKKSRQVEPSATMKRHETPCNTTERLDKIREEESREEKSTVERSSIHQRDLPPTGVGEAPDLTPPPSNPKTPSNSKPKRPQKIWYSQAFDEWYSDYWRKAGRQDADKAYVKAVNRLVDTKAVAGYNAAKLYLERQKIEFRQRFENTTDWDSNGKLHASTWLNGQRWTDEASPSRAGLAVVPRRPATREGFGDQVQRTAIELFAQGRL